MSQQPNLPGIIPGLPSAPLGPTNESLPGPGAPASSPPSQPNSLTCDPAAIEAALRTFVAPDQLTELRILNFRDQKSAEPHNLVALYRGQDFAEMAKEAARYSGRAEGVYFIPNPINPSFRGKRKFGWVCQAHTGTNTAADRNVLARRWVVVDIDPNRPAGQSATNDEKLAASHASDILCEKIEAATGHIPIKVDSGNGYHVYLQIDPPQPIIGGKDPEVQEFLAVLGHWLSGSSVKIDKSIFNPARILKVPGTLASKGENTPERPWRLSRIVVDELCPQPLTWQQFLTFKEALKRETNYGPPASKHRPSTTHPPASAGSSAVDPERIRKYMAAVDPAISGQGGHSKTLYAACQLIEGFDLSPEEAYPYLAEWNQRCQPPWPEAQLRRKLSEADKRTAGKPRGHLRESTGGSLTSEFAGVDLSGIEAFLYPNGRPAGAQPIGTDGASVVAWKSPADTPAAPAIPASFTGQQAGRPATGTQPSAFQRLASAKGPAGLIPITTHDEDPLDPFRLTRKFLELHWDRFSDLPMIRFWRGDFYRYDAGCYVKIDGDALKSEIGKFAKLLLDQETASLQAEYDAEGEPGKKKKKGKKPVPPKVTRNVKNEIIDCLQDVLNLTEADLPFWIADPADLSTAQPWPDMRDCIVCENLIVHIPSLCDDNAPVYAVAHNPRFFTMTKVAYPFTIAEDVVEQFRASHWKKVLESGFKNDLPSIDLLQEWAGYLLTQKCEFQKMLMLIGPGGCGKSVVMKVLSELIGQPNCISGGLYDLESQFSLQDWIGKSAAFFPDASISSKWDMAKIQDILRRITGGDHIDVDRKFMPRVRMRLNARITITSNEILAFFDKGDAILRRLLILRMEKGFEGPGDKDLMEKLTAELPMIFLWAIEGYKRLFAAGRFTVPASSQSDFDDYEETMTPIKRFVRDRCEIHSEAKVLSADLYKAYEEWCKAVGHYKASDNIFGRDIKAAFYPTIKRERLRTPSMTESESKREYYFIGLRVLE